MIGDDWEADIVGAKNMGIDQIFFNRTNILTPFAPTYEVNHISMIKKLL
jgi:putative hydrolase of the HAD superfamily